MTRNLLKLLTAFALSGVAAISMASDSGFIADELRAVHSQLTDTRRWVDSDIGANLSHRWESAPRRLTDSGLRFAESGLEGLPWVTEVDLHRITRNGNYLAGFGVSGVGLLWTGESHALGFQPSGEWIDGSGDDFASFGVFGRKAVGDWGVIGANVFGDYASDSELGEFSRWSLGADFQSELADLRGNWYSEGTGFRSRRIQGGEVFAYSPSGVDAELNLRWRGVSEWTGFAEYEKWDGRFGDSDTQDVGFGVTYRPLGGGVLAGLEVDAGYFTSAGADDRLDLRFEYSRTLGGDNRAMERDFGFGIQSALVAPVIRERRIEIAEAPVFDPGFFGAESRIYRHRDGMWVADQRPFMLEVKSRCTLVYDYPRTPYEQDTSAELHEQAENPSKFDDLCDTINKTANIRTTDSNGNLATHRAVSGIAPDNFKLLVVAGVRATATNSAGKTPLDLAQSRHRSETDSEVRETLSTIAMVIRAVGGECAAESGTLCTIAYDALYEGGGVVDFGIYDDVIIPSNFQGDTIYQLHHPEYGRMTVISYNTPRWDARATVTADGNVQIEQGALLKAGNFYVERFVASNEHLPYDVHVNLIVSISVVSHPQPWTIPPIRKVVPNYTGTYFTVTAVPPNAQLGYSFGPGERAVYRLLSASNNRINSVTDGNISYSHADFMFADDLRSYDYSAAYFSSDIEAAAWLRGTVQIATADQRLVGTYYNGAFAVSLNQAIGQGDPEVRAVHMFVDPYDYRNETQTLNFTIATPDIPPRSVRTVGAKFTGLLDILEDEDLRNVRYEVIEKDPQLALNSVGQLRVDSAISVGKDATLSAKITSPDLLGTLTIAVRILSHCTSGEIVRIPRNDPDYHPKGRKLNEAAEMNDIDEVCRLISEGADTDYQASTGHRPLDRGALDGDGEIAGALIVHGAEPNYASGEDEYTPLHFAARELNLEYARVLLENGALVTAKTAQDDEVIHSVGSPSDATKEDYIAFYRLLTDGDNGADIDARGNQDRTPLIKAVVFDAPLLKIKALLDLGARKSIRDEQQMTACDYAKDKREIRGALGCQ